MSYSFLDTNYNISACTDTVHKQAVIAAYVSYMQLHFRKYFFWVLIKAITFCVLLVCCTNSLWETFIVYNTVLYKLSLGNCKFVYLTINMYTQKVNLYCGPYWREVWTEISLFLKLIINNCWKSKKKELFQLLPQKLSL